MKLHLHPIDIYDSVTCKRYGTIETRKSAVLDMTAFFFTRGRMRKKKPVKSDIGNFFCFNSNVSNLLNKNVDIKRSAHDAFLE